MSRYIDADLLQEDFKADHGGKRSLMIDVQPTADVRENVRGEWIDITAKHKDTGECKEAQQCSVCGAVYLRYYGEEDGFEVVKPNFCPNCGADMRGES